jgi:hypothetical protein
MLPKGLVIVVVAAVTLASPSLARAANCGDRDEAGKIIRGTLTLSAAASQTSLRFLRSERTRKLGFDYDVTGCEIPEGAMPPQVEVLPHGDTQLPDEAVDILTPAPSRDGVRVNVRVDPKKLDPDKYDLAVRITAPYLAKQITPGYVSRSDAAYWKPLTAALLGGIVAFAFGLAGIAAKTEGDTEFISLWFFIGLAAAVGAGLWVMFSSYWSADVEVWKWPDDWAKTLAAAFGAGSAGAIAGLVAKAVGSKNGGSGGKGQKGGQAHQP